MPRASFRVLWSVLLLLLCAACTAVEPAQGSTNGTHVGEIAGRHTAGQTFIPHHDGLAGIEVELATFMRQNTGTLTLHLRAGPAETADLRTVSVSAASVQDNGFQRFAFAPLPDVAGRQYYFYLEAPDATPGNAVTAWRAEPGTYSSGSLYLGGQPVEGQLAFNLVYAQDYALSGLAAEMLRAVPPALGVVALLVLPGLALVLWLARPAWMRAPWSCWLRARASHLCRC